MKRFVFSIIVVLSICIACSAQAQLTVYDDFSGSFIDTERWYHRHTPSVDLIWPYDGGFRILKGKLSYYSRVYGTQQAVNGTENYRRFLGLRNATDITAIEASVQVAKNGHEITGCPTPGYSEPSETRIFLGGAFFNDGTSGPGSGTSVGDIAAYMGFYKYSDSATIPPGYMGVRARVRQCTNADCSSDTLLWETLFNNLLVKVGKKTLFRITLDKGTNTFTFQVGKKDFASYTYTANDPTAPGRPNMRLEVAHYLANCPSPAARTVGWADVLFDYVSID